MNTSQTEKTEVIEYRAGRNFVRVGDTVKCKPISGFSFRAKVRRILADESGIVEVEVVRGIEDPSGHCGFRTFRPCRISRVAQSRVQVRA